MYVHCTGCFMYKYEVYFILARGLKSKSSYCSSE